MRCILCVFFWLTASLLPGWFTKADPIVSMASGVADAPLEVQEFERFALAARRAIVSGEFRVHRVALAKLPATENLEEDIITRISGAKVREDQIRNGITSTEIRGNRYYSFSGVKSSDGRPMSLMASDVSTVGPGDNYLYEPLKLMFHPTWYRAAEDINLQSYIGSSDRHGITFENTYWDGVPALKVSFICNRNKCKFTYWGVPSYGYSVVKMVADCDKQFCSVEGRVAKIADGSYFPIEVHCQIIDSGKVSLDERLTIVASHLNEVVDPSVFEPAGMSLEAGTKVHLQGSEGKQLKWDGKNIVVMSDSEVRARMLADTMPNSQRSRRVFYITISALLAAMGLLLIWQIYRRQYASNGPPNRSVKQ